jgi:hypothetical protein
VRMGHEAHRANFRASSVTVRDRDTIESAA